ncbi:hypothetical protein Peur_004562 [Populus x canadensis]
MDVCGLLETKLSLAKVECLHKFRLKTWQFVSNAGAAAYARAFSDHAPSTVQLGLRAPQGNRNFKFFNMWTTHPQFLETISQNWSLDAYGTPMYILCKKLKLLKGSLRSLNSLHFSHISERVTRAEQALDDTQLLLQNDMDNGQLLALEKLQRLSLVNLKGG